MRVAFGRVKNWLILKTVLIVCLILFKEALEIYLSNIFIILSNKSQRYKLIRLLKG